MNASLSSLWNTAVDLGITQLTAGEFALLILLGAALLSLRACRESYFKIWIAGWTVFVASRLMEHPFANRFPAPFGEVAIQASFVLAVGLLT